MVKFFTVEIKLEGFNEDIIFKNAYTSYQIGNMFCVKTIGDNFKDTTYQYPLCKIIQVEIYETKGD